MPIDARDGKGGLSADEDPFDYDEAVAVGVIPSQLESVCEDYARIRTKVVIVEDVLRKACVMARTMPCAEEILAGLHTAQGILSQEVPGGRYVGQMTECAQPSKSASHTGRL